MNRTISYRSKVNNFFVRVIFTILAIIGFRFVYDEYKANEGTTAIIDGTITDKQYVAAHTSTSGCLLFFSSEYQPEKYVFSIRRFNNAKKAWETANVDVDKDTYNAFAKNAHYVDTSGKTAFFHIESMTANSWH